MAPWGSARVPALDPGVPGVLVNVRGGAVDYVSGLGFGDIGDGEVELSDCRSELFLQNAWDVAAKLAPDAACNHDGADNEPNVLQAV